MSTIGNFCLNLWRRIDWKFNQLTLIEVALLLAIYPLMRWQWPDAAYYVEDGWVENIQLAVLAIAAIIVFNTRNEHRLFVFAGLILKPTCFAAISVWLIWSRTRCAAGKILSTDIWLRGHVGCLWPIRCIILCAIKFGSR